MIKRRLIYIYGWMFVRPRRFVVRKIAFPGSICVLPRRECGIWFWPNVHWFILHKTIWPLLSWLYWDGWRWFCKWEDGYRSTYPLMARFVRWIGRTTAGVCISPCQECFHCGFEAGNQVDLSTGTNFILEDSGESYSENGTSYWFRGTTICPVCGYTDSYEDST